MKNRMIVQSLCSTAVFAVCFGCGAAAGQAPQGEADGVGWPWLLLTLPESETVVAGLIALGGALLVRWNWVRKYRLERAMQCLSSGVRETYEEYVRSVKQASQDGKLTKEEREAAMRLAIEKAKEYARVEGVDLLKIYAEEYLPVLIDRIIGERKAS